MCGGALGLARTLSRTMPRRKPSFLKRHPECKHNPSSPRKVFKVKYTPRPDVRLIYYSECRHYPTGVHHKILYAVLTLIGTPLVLSGILFNLAFFGEVAFWLMLAACAWTTALLFMAAQVWGKQPKAYRKPKDPVELETW